MARDLYALEAMVLSNGMAQGPGATEEKCGLSHGRNLLSGM